MKLYPVLLPIIVWWLIQLIKACIDFSKNKKDFFRNIISSWWFPSVHSGITSSLAMVVFLKEWFSSVAFAIAFVFALIISYDAVNIRYEAWKHATYINKISIELESVLHSKPRKQFLRERLWHTRREVLWWIVFGCALTTLLYKLWYVW